MKKLLIFSMIIAGSLAISSAKAQVHVDAQIGIGAPVVYERDYPGYSYYTYPTWRGHYQDRDYYAHYHRRFEREHRPYFHDRSFDHERYERERHDNGRDHDRDNGRDHDRRDR